MKNVISKVVSEALFNYVDPLQANQLQLQIFQGKAKIENLIIKESALAYHDLPFSVTKGIIEETNITIPWSSLQSEPCILELRGVYIFGTIQEEVFVTSQLQLKRSLLQAIESQAESVESSSSKKSTSSFTTILHNLQVSIKDIHICLEIKNKTGISYAGITLKELLLFTCDEKGQKRFIKSENEHQYRKLTIDSLSFYLDTNPEPINFDHFNEHMHDSILKPHQRILSNMYFSNIFEVNDNIDAEFRYSFKLVTEHIKLQIDEQQYINAANMFTQMQKVRQKIRFGTCGRPTISPVNEIAAQKWFAYGYHCIQEQKNPNKLHVGNILAILKNRKSYYSLWKEKTTTGNKFSGSKNDLILKKLEDKLELNTILFLRSYSEIKMRKEQSKTLEFTKEELEQLSILKNKISSNNNLNINLDIQNLIINIQTLDKRDIGSIIFKKINGFFLKKSEGSNSSLSFSNIQVFSQTKALLSQMESQGEQSCRILYDFQPENLKHNLKLFINQPHLTADMEEIMNLVSFFIKTMPKSTNYLESSKEISKQDIKKLIQERINFDFNLKLEKPEIVVPSKSNLVLNLQNLEIKKQDKNQDLFDFYDVFLNNFSAKIGDDGLTENLSVKAVIGLPIIDLPDIESIKISTEIPEITVNLSKQNYLDFISIFKPLTNLDFEKSDKNQKNKTKKNKSFEMLLKKCNIKLDNEQNIYLFVLDNFKAKSDKNVSILFDNISLTNDQKEIIGLQNVTFSTNETNGEIKVDKINNFVIEELSSQFLMKSIVLISNLLKDENEKSNDLIINFDYKEKLNISMIDRNNSQLGNLVFSNLQLKIKSINDDLILYFKLDDIEMFLTEINSKFIKFDNNTEIEYIFHKKVTLNSAKSDISFDFYAMMNLIDFFNRIIDADLIKYDDNPLTFPYLNFDINLQKIDLKMLIDKNPENFILYNINDLKFNSNEVGKLNIMINSLESENLIKINNFESSFNLILKNELPELNLGVDEQFLERYKVSKDIFYIHSINSDVKIPNLSLYLTDDKVIENLLKSVKFIFNILAKPVYFVIENIAKVNLDAISLNLYDQQVKLNKIIYSLQEKCQNIGFDTVEFNSKFPIFKQRTNVKNPGKILEIKLTEKVFELKFNNCFIGIVPDVVFPLYEKFQKCPLITFDYGLGNDQNKGFNLLLNNSTICIPSDLENNGPCLFFDNTNLQIYLSENSQRILITSIQIAFSQFSDKILLYPPILSDFLSDIIVEKKGEMTNLSLLISDFNIYISAADIATIILVTKSVLSKLPKINTRNVTQGFLVDSIKFNIGTMTLTFCEDNRSILPPLPFMRIILPQTDFIVNLQKNQKFSFEYTFNSIDLFNETTSNWDVLVEPLSFVLHGSKSDGYVFSFDIANSLNINLSHRMLKKILIFSENVKSIKENKGIYKVFPEFEILNKTARNVDISLLNGVTMTMAPGEVLPTYDLKSNKSLKVTTNNVTFSITPQQLSFPMIPEKNIVVYKYMKGNVSVIVITSSIVVQNMTSQNLTIFTKQNKNFKHGYIVDSNSFTEIPDFNPKTDDLVFGDKAAKAIDIKKLDNIINYKFTHDDKEMSVLIQKKFELLRGLTVIYINTPIRIVNNLPFETMFRLNDDKNILLKENQEKIVDYLKIDKNEISVKISMSNGIETSDKNTIKLQNGFVNPIKVDSTLNIAYLVTENDEDKVKSLVFYIPCILYNETGKDLYVCDSNGNSSNFREKGDLKYILFGPITYFDEEKPSMHCHLSAGISYDISLNPIDCSLSNVDDFVLCPLRKNPFIYIPFHFCVKSDSSNSNGIKTQKVTITNHITLKNELNYEFKLQPIFNIEEGKSIGDPFVVKPQSEMPINFVTKSSCFYFQVEKFRKVPICLKTANFTTFRIITEDDAFEQKFICLLINANSYGLNVTFSDASLNSPILVQNLLKDIPICAYQIPDSTPFVIMSDEVKPFAFDYPELNRDVYLMVNSTDLKIDISELNSSKEFLCRGVKIFTEVRTDENGCKTIIVSSEKQTLPISENLHFFFNVPQISVSLIHEDLRELALATIRQISMEYSSVSNLSTVTFTIDSFQLDDMFADVPLPVVSFCQKEFLSFACEFYNNTAFATAFKNFELKVNPITAFLDTSFLSEIMMFFSTAFRESYKYNNDLSKREKLLNMKSTNKMISSNTIYSFDKFKIDPILLIFSIRSHTNRVHLYRFFSKGIYMAPDVTNATLDLDGIEFTSASFTSSFLVFTVFDGFKKSAMKQMLNILGHMDVLMNISEIGSLYKRDIKQLQSGDFKNMKPPAVLVGSLTGTESFVRGASSLMHGFIEGDNNRSSGGLNRNAAETVGDGFVSFGKGIALGFAGIVTKPMEEGKKGGFLGGLKGLGKGLAGAIASPFTGVLDIGAGIVGAARKAIENDNMTISRERCQRCFFHYTVKNTSAYFDRCQEEIHNMDLLRSTYNDMIFIGAMTDSGGSICVTLSRIFIFDNENKIIYNSKFKHVDNIMCQDKTLVIKVSDKLKPIKLNIVNPDISIFLPDLLSLYSIEKSLV